MNDLPNLLVLGAQKGGTTSIHRRLVGHPQVFVPEGRKELHAWSYRMDDESPKKVLADLQRKYAHGSSWPWRADVCPSYLHHPEAAHRAAGHLQDPTFIITLRDPVERAWSHYLMACHHPPKKEVRETRSFSQAIDDELAGTTDHLGRRRRFSYLDNGNYAEQIQRWKDAFPGAPLHILVLEEWKQQEGLLDARLADALGIDPAGFAADTLRAHNTHREPRSRLAAWLRDSNAVHGIARAFTPLALRRWVGRRLVVSTPKPEMDPEDRERLRELFSGSVDDLEEVLGHGLSAARQLWTVR